MGIRMRFNSTSLAGDSVARRPDWPWPGEIRLLNIHGSQTIPLPGFGSTRTTNTVNWGSDRRVNPGGQLVHQTDKIESGADFPQLEICMSIASRLFFAAVLAAGFLFLASPLLRAKSPNPLTSFPKPVLDDPIASSKGQRETAVLSGGCFWGVQAV